MVDKTADKIDFKKEIEAYRARQGRFQVVDVPDLQYLMIDGHGDPNTDPAFAHATEALYPLAYALKFASKRELGRDYVVMPLEGLWWADDMDSFTAARDKSRWDWTLMIMVPDWIEPGLFAAAVEQVAAKNRPARLLEVRLDGLSEGRCVQTLHIGSYDDETEVLARMHHEFVPDNGFRMVGRHHEIYLGDARKVAPEKLRTILRQPVVAAGV
ncbi:GyrI-like domain-containing protein [Nocardia fusca]|uniref:GyrI-like domain-containing protein n=1 Tax=Nocardia fusca TaxID=941183 RepID=UPI0037CB1927